MDNYFFSFGPKDSYVSKSPEGLKHRRLPPKLLRLLTSDDISDVKWAAIGPGKESWVLLCTSSRGSSELHIGTGSPPALKTYLTNPKTHKSFCDPHLRVVFGPHSSFFAWCRTSIRWSNIPVSLEETVQSWLSPTGWKVGPPRMVALGADDAWFALSEYGAAAWDIPDGNESLAETWNEWESEGFDWGDLAFIAFDPTKPDQFVAIRSDQAWEAAIDDSNSEALESFATSYFKSPPRPPQPSAQRRSSKAGRRSVAAPPSPAIQAHYETWAAHCATIFAAAATASHVNHLSSPPSHPDKTSPANYPSSSATPTPSLITVFPYLPSAATTCTLPACVAAKAAPFSLRACVHDVETLFRGSGLYSYEWLRRERLRWHPDQFARLCAEGYREEGAKVAAEMWKICLHLMEAEKGKGKG
ncbi:hypothetical protein K432DRAFT_377144 [Lepidopterella palustris CBS 459.81]|uniref:Uncharacterized protein n=1 Tax=Lepidopterella palustris CBS 459.81 TaxID=1314670 RepID=A0A8E2JKH5_9PEZI|nr:hypothetical protein K432DRAFT_377144 [Lepidopterella palustris CBS 459.81]